MSKHLKTTLESIYSAYHRPSYLCLDPLEFVHGFTGRENREIAGMICSSLAYGRVEQIRKSISVIFERTGNDLYQFSLRVPLKEKLRMLSSFKHRFNNGRDIAILLECCAVVLKEQGSIESLFCKGFRSTHETIKEALTGFCSRMLAIAGDMPEKVSPAFRFFFPSPGSGSSCKRLNMYLRWMVRKDDGIDLGIWKKIPASKLVMPVDTHVARISRRLGMTKRNSADWAMADEITAALKRISPKDPLRYDFSLCRTGMIDFRNYLKKA